jgi:membrane protease YdiL (CAAX protease family)
MSTPVTIPEIPETRPDALRRVGPAWHTVVLILVLLANSLAGALSHHVPGLPHWLHGLEKPTDAVPKAMATYLGTILLETILTVYVLWGVRRSGMRIRDFIGGRWNTPERFLIDVVIAVAFWFASHIVLLGAVVLVKHFSPATLDRVLKVVTGLAPRSRLEIVLALTLSVVVGIAEEIVFRGYLQRQFAAWSHSVAAGIVLSALVFGMSHGYQGAIFMSIIALYGAMFGLLAHFAKSLRPGMLSHFMNDAIALLLARVVKVPS